MKTRGVWRLPLPILSGLALSLLAQVPSEKTIRLPGDNAMAQLKRGPGVEVTRNNCAICHSTDYIVRQPGSDAKRWDAEVQKMIKVFGAPISEADAKIIVNYLASAYGPAPESVTRPASKAGKQRKAPPSVRIQKRIEMHGEVLHEPPSYTEPGAGTSLHSPTPPE